LFPYMLICIISTNRILGFSLLLSTKLNSRSLVNLLSLTNSIDDDNNILNVDRQFFLRFSPLVGGPTFLPIHVEVILLDSVFPRQSKQRSVVEYFEEPKSISKTNDMDFRAKTTPRECLHRLDFLPQNPSNPSIITKLLTFQSVPGVIRHRVLIAPVISSNQNYAGDGKDKGIETLGEYLIQQVPKSRIDYLIGKGDASSGKSYVIVVPLGSTSIRQSFHKDFDLRHVSKLPISTESLLQQQAGMELNLLNNNCYSFAWGVLQSFYRKNDS